MAEIVELGEAVEELVSDGDSIPFEGFTHLIAFPPAALSPNSTGTLADAGFGHCFSRRPGAKRRKCRKEESFVFCVI